MEKENLILCCIITLAAVCYSTLERKQLIKIGKKLRISMFNFNPYKPKEETYSTKLKKWHYRGEGNSHVSLSLPETRQILRIKKIPYPTGIKEKVMYYFYNHTPIGDIIETKERIEGRANLKFYNSIRALLGESYVQPAQEALLNKEEIQEIDGIIEPLRPTHRKKKHLAYACGSLLADYAYFPFSWDLDDINPTYSIEIKPKHGWIPPNERKYSKCTYCLNQYIKLQNKEIDKISKYCPMDLFSGSLDRMKHAINCLIETPQNNFKIFKNGLLVYDDNSRKTPDILCEIFAQSYATSLEELSDVLTKALLINLSKENQCPIVENKQKMENKLEVSVIPSCDFSQDKLVAGCVLERILNVQKLDQWGSEEILSKLQTQGIDLNQKTSIPLCKLNCQKDFSSIVKQYLMAAVAKDLSLMITFKRLLTASLNVPQKNIIKTDNGSLYAMQIGVFDLYPKSATSILKHVEKRQMIGKVYQHLLEKQN